jgi:signal transduction histidine kinase
LQVSDILRIFAGMNFKKIIFSIALLLVSVTLAAQQKPSEKELQLVQSLQEAQINGSDSDFYEAHKAFMDYLEQQKDWNKYYRSWLNRIIYEVNHKRFHRAYAETDLMTDDIKARHQEGYIYMLYMGLGFFYNGRNQPEMGEKFFRRALEEIQTDKDPVAVFNAYLSLAQSLSFKRPAEAMACLDSLPQQMLQNPMYESGVLGYRCIIANKLGDRKAFNRYFVKYDSIRQHQPDQFNATNLEQVMVSHCLIQKDYQCALAWCDSIDVPLIATELRMDVYEEMGDWERAFQTAMMKDSLTNMEERESLEQHLLDMSHDLDILQAEQEKAETRRIQLVIVGLMATVIIGLLIGLLVYRHKKNQRLKEQFLQLQEARRDTEAGQAIRRAFVNAIYDKLKSPINVLRGYARIFNDPNFLLKPEERPKRYSDIITAAQSIESLIDPVLDSYVRGTAGITEEEKRVCMDALRSPLLTLINTSEIIIEGHGEIPHNEYMELRSSVCREAYHVSTATHQLILFSLYGDDMPIQKPDRLKLNEMAQTVLNSYELSPSAIDQNRHLPTEFITDVADDVEVNTSPMLHVLLDCLLDNSDKYASGGTVRMSCHDCGDGTYAIAVANECPAIAAEDAERIFEPFIRLSPEEHSLGIGLPLARRLAKSMGYEVSLDMEYTKGSRFVVSGIC